MLLFATGAENPILAGFAHKQRETRDDESATRINAAARRKAT